MSTKDFYQVIVSDQATKMLISHSVFLSQVDPAAAEHLIIEFGDCFKFCVNTKN